jgi:hypothetical protein
MLRKVVDFLTQKDLQPGRFLLVPAVKQLVTPAQLVVPAK